jgi:AmmeMemoRadiSam system protein B
LLAALLLLGLPSSPAAASSRLETDLEKPRPEILESFFKNKELYEEAFAKAGGPEKSRVQAGIVPHHFLARDLMARFFNGIAHPSVRRVILVGPDHFRSFGGTQARFFTSLLPWRTPFGGLEPDREIIHPLLAENDSSLNDLIFMREHSIWVLVPFVKKAFPQARIIPLVLRKRGEYERFRELGATLAELDRGEGLLVASTDFSHGVSPGEAATLDRESIAYLQSLNPANIAHIHCDCRPCLAVLLGFLGAEEKAFTLLARQTSRDLGAPPHQPLTSYVSGYYRRGRQTARVLMVGDLFFDRHIRKVAGEKGYDFPLREVKDLLLDTDLVVANLEGPLTDAPSVSEKSRPGEPDHYRFTFPPGVAKTLADHRINLVNLGNNHVLDFGRPGLKRTKEYLDRALIGYFGTPGNPGEKSRVLDVGGWKWAFVSFNQFAGEGAAPTLREIKQRRGEADLVVVYAHWGLEYSKAPGPRLRQWARDFIDRGADLVVGSHPHVVQEKEEYRGKIIYYSLGNFVFDQYFRRDTARGLAVQVTVRPPNRRLELEEIPLSLTPSGQTRVMLESR